MLKCAGGPGSHRCVGLCGEPCPLLCRTCHPSQLDQILTHLKVPPAQTTGNPPHRFILLQPCGHTVEVKYMDKWVESTKMVPPCEVIIFMELKCYLEVYLH